MNWVNLGVSAEVASANATTFFAQQNSVGT